MDNVYICSSFRTPIGSFNGQYTNVSASKLGSCVLRHCLEKAGVKPEDVSEVILGQVLTAGQGQNPARQAAVLAKIPPEVPASTVNMACGSGLRAIYNGYNAIRAREASIVLAGGQENMSQSEHSINLRSNRKIGHIGMKDSAVHDGATCSILDMHLGEVSEDLTAAFDIQREVQDKFALMSHFRACKAIESGYFSNEVVPTHEHVAFFDINIDECPQPNTTLESMKQFKPLFRGCVKSGCEFEDEDDNNSRSGYVPQGLDPAGGSITQGNSSPMADGAACVLLVNGKELCEKNLTPQVYIAAMAQVGCEPIQMGLGPIAAIKKVLEKAKWSLEEVELFEINEAYAVQTMLCVNVLNIDFSKVNVTGGSIALGNPLGAAGTRILVTLIHNMERLEKNKGVAAMCIGGGLALAVAVHRCQGSGVLANPVRVGVYEGQDSCTNFINKENNTYDGLLCLF